MPELVTLELRKSFRYVDACSHMDNWEQIGVGKFLPAKQRSEGNGYDVGPSYTQEIQVKAAHNPKKVKRALTHMLSFSNCMHEYDCCGCLSGNARIRQVRPGLFTAHIQTYRNY